MNDKQKKRIGTSLLSLALDGSQLEGVEIRRTNGSVEIRRKFAVTLALDPLTSEPELVGREIRNHLTAAGVKERNCAVCLPLNWALTLNARLPDLPEEDVESFLQMEAERGFPYGPEALSLSTSRFQISDAEKHATLLAIPLDHIARLEAVLQAAQLRPVSFSLGLTALERPDPGAAGAVIALIPGESSVGLQVTCGGGVVVLRTVEGVFEMQSGEQVLQPDVLARELRITLGQLPPEIRDQARRLRVFGRSAAAEGLAAELRSRLHSQGIQVEPVRDCAPGMFKVQVPSGSEMSPALSLAVRLLSGQDQPEFLPAKISQWKQLTTRYSSSKLVTAGAVAGTVAVIIALAFLVQEIFLQHWKSKLATVEPRAKQVKEMEDFISKYRPWFDESYQSLSILSRVTSAFPQDGTVTAKTLEIHENTRGKDALTIVITGTARENAPLLKTRDDMQKTPGIKNLEIENITGKVPQLKFTIKFGWGGAPTGK